MLSPLARVNARPYVIVLGPIVPFFVPVGFATNLFLFKDRLAEGFYHPPTGPLSIIIHSMNVAGEQGPDRSRPPSPTCQIDKPFACQLLTSSKTRPLFNEPPFSLNQPSSAVLGVQR
jgi:hypothetical protein